MRNVQGSTSRDDEIRHKLLSILTLHRPLLVLLAPGAHLHLLVEPGRRGYSYFTNVVMIDDFYILLPDVWVDAVIGCCVLEVALDLSLAAVVARPPETGKNPPYYLKINFLPSLIKQLKGSLNKHVHTFKMNMFTLKLFNSFTAIYSHTQLSLKTIS